MNYEHDPYKQEADELVKRFLAELDACKTEDERIHLVWALVYGIVKGARKQEEDR